MAHRQACRLHEEQLVPPHDFTDKSGVVHSEGLLPETAPDERRDRERLRNYIDARIDHSNLSTAIQPMENVTGNCPRTATWHMIHKGANETTHRGAMRRPLFYADARFSAATRDHWTAIETSLSRLPKFPVDIGLESIFSQWLTDDLAEIIRDKTRDELTRHYSGSQRSLGIISERVPSEILTLQLYESSSPVMDRTSLEQLASLCTGTPNQKIRRFRNFTSAGAQGRSQEFVSPHELDKAMKEFYRVWNDTVLYGDGQSIIWLFIALLNAHPFRDGNGRLARSLLNFKLLKEGYLNGTPIPFAPLIYAAGGNFEIAMGRAAIMNEWEPVFRSIRFLIEFYENLSKEFAKFVEVRQSRYVR